MIKILGTHDEQTVAQLENCVAAEDGARGVLCADGHLGYSMPIGGVVAYKDHISPSGVGYDIACGNMAIRTPLKIADMEAELPRIADEIASRISFGVGRNNNEPVDDDVLDRIRKSPIPAQRNLIQLAANQLGTVGSGNHYVDVLEDENGFAWVAVHFGSRGFGHKTASMFMNAAQGRPMTDKPHEGEMMSPPLLINVNTPLGQDYIEAMEIAGEYAYAGRRIVAWKVAEILGGAHAVIGRGPEDIVHNHHNFAWREQHFGEDLWVVRKGATPLMAWQRGFIGGSMGDISVVLQGKDTPLSRNTLFSAPHGAGRVLSRNAAIKGKHIWMCSQSCGYELKFGMVPPKNLLCPVCAAPLEKRQVTPPINFEEVKRRQQERGIILRGAGPDESPEVYRPLGSVLSEHRGTYDLIHEFRPRIVVMAGKEVQDPYKD